MKDNKFEYVKNHMVLSYHAKHNKKRKRKDIPINCVVDAITNARYVQFAGDRRFKVTYKGVTVVYKMDNKYPNNKLYVVITYYRASGNSHKTNLRKLLTC